MEKKRPFARVVVFRRTRVCLCVVSVICGLHAPSLNGRPLNSTLFGGSWLCVSGDTMRHCGIKLISANTVACDCPLAHPLPLSRPRRPCWWPPSGSEGIRSILEKGKIHL